MVAETRKRPHIVHYAAKEAYLTQTMSRNDTRYVLQPLNPHVYSLLAGFKTGGGYDIIALSEFG